MDFRYCQSIKDPETGNMLIIGKMQSPVTWEFKISFQPEDIGGIVKIALCPAMLFYALKNLPQYLIYLMSRNKFKHEGDLTEKVNAAYEQCMTGGRVYHRGPEPLSSIRAAAKEV